MQYFICCLLAFQGRFCAVIIYIRRLKYESGAYKCVHLEREKYLYLCKHFTYSKSLSADLSFKTKPLRIRMTIT